MLPPNRQHEDKDRYFSKNIVPYVRNINDTKRIYKHIGVYGYRINVLKKIVQLPSSNLEDCEGLEQLRILENDIQIHIVIVETRGRTLQ